MTWHIELFILAALVIVLWRKPAPRCFCVLIGITFVAGLLQIIPYRAGYREYARVIWMIGMLAVWPLNWISLVEAGEMERGRIQFWHLRILAGRVSMRTLILALQMTIERTAYNERHLLPPEFYWLNTALWITDAVAFSAWITLFS